MRVTALLWLAAGGAASLEVVAGHGFYVRTPDALAGLYWERRSLLSPPQYGLGALVEIAATCPCSWTVGMTYASAGLDELAGAMLIVPDTLCANHTQCSPSRVACAANAAGESAALLSCTAFGDFSAGGAAPASDSDEDACYMAVARETLTSTDDKASLSACLAKGLPIAFLRANDTRHMLEVAATPGNATNGSSQPLRTAASDAGLTHSLYLQINASLWHARDDDDDDDDDEIDCDRYRHAPLVYMITSPAWWVLAALWTYNTHHLNAESARDIHRLLTWVPVVQGVHSLLSLLNYSSCPWDGTLATIGSTFWAVLTILKEPLMLLW